MEPKVHDHVHSGLPLVPIARHMNLIDTLLSYLITALILSSNTPISPQIVFFFQTFPPKFPMHLSTFSYMPPCLILKNILVTLTNKRLLTIKPEISRPFAITYILPQGLSNPDPCATNRDMLNSDPLAKPPRITVTTWSVVRDCLLHMTSATSHLEVVSFHHQHGDTPFRGERKSFNMGHHLSLCTLFS